MRLERFDPYASADQAQACHAMYLAGVPVDNPDGPVMHERPFITWLALGWLENYPEVWLAREEDGQPCGWYSAEYPRREDTHLGHLSLLVSPEWRRQGIGSAIFGHAAARARAEGRTALAVEAKAGSAAEAFCRALGGRCGLAEVRRVLRLAALPPGLLARLRAEAEQAAAGYSLAYWETTIPEAELAAVAEVAEAIRDAPRDPGRDDQRWDTDRMRESQQRITDAGLRYYTVAARHDRTGELAGVTQLSVEPPAPDWGFQQLTAVTRGHRGHRLGLLLKVAMLEWLGRAEPQLRTILTGNADANKHMIAINEALGFEELDRWHEWELPVPPGTAAA